MVLRLIPIFVTLLFILFQTVEIKVKMRSKLTVKINFNILAIVLYEDKRRKTRLKALFSLVSTISKFTKSIKYLISKSKVSVIIYPKNDENNLSILRHIGSLASEQFLLSYLEANSKEFYATRSEYLPEKCSDSKTFFDVNLNLSFMHLIISALILLYYIIKSKAKEVIKNV